MVLEETKAGLPGARIDRLHDQKIISKQMLGRQNRNVSLAASPLGNDLSCSQYG